MKRALLSTLKYGSAAIAMATTLSASAIISGRPADKRIGKAAIYVYDEKNQASCSGVVVHPRLILTAAHCLIHTKKNLLSFSNSRSPYKSKFSLPISDLITHEGYAGDQNGLQSSTQSAGDLGLIVLSESILGKFDLVLADLPPIATDASDLEYSLRIIGFGYESRSATHETAAKRELLVSIAGAIAKPTALRLESLEEKKSACFGDSGSGVFADDGHEARLVGIVCSIKPGGKLAEEFAAKSAAARAKNEEKRQKQIAKNLKKGITTPVPVIPINLSEGLLSRVCGDKDTVTQAIPVARHLCWIQKATSISLVSGLDCSSSGVK